MAGDAVASAVQWIERLGSGDSGVVWGVVREGVPFAWKIVRPRNEEHRDAIFDQLARQPEGNGPGFVKVDSCELTDGLLHLGMPWIHGPSLQQVVKGRMNQGFGMLPPSVAVSWAASVLMQLHEIRSWAGADWFHGALRPAHVLLGPQGELYILDPILSKAAREIGLPGRAVDAPQYAAPETFSGQYTFLSDQFSVGAILAEWLTGSPLYAARDPSELQILAEEADVSRSVAASRQYPALGAVIQKLLAKDPRHRFSDSSAAAEALSDLFIEGPTREQMTAELLEWSERFRMLEGADAHFDEMDVPEGADDATDDLLADVTPMVPHAVSAGPIDEGEPESTPVSGMWERTRKPSETPTAITHPDAVERERANLPITVTHTMVAERPWWESRWFAFFVGATLIAAPTLWWLLRS